MLAAISEQKMTLAELSYIQEYKKTVLLYQTFHTNLRCGLLPFNLRKSKKSFIPSSGSWVMNIYVILFDSIWLNSHISKFKGNKNNTMSSLNKTYSRGLSVSYQVKYHHIISTELCLSLFAGARPQGWEPYGQALILDINQLQWAPLPSAKPLIVGYMFNLFDHVPERAANFT